MLHHLATLLSEELHFAGAALAHRWAERGAVVRWPVLVNGSPKSGTTWMVKLLASLPGYRAVGNFQGVTARYRAAAAGDVIHGHDACGEALAALLREPPALRLVLMVRDPRDQLVSRYFHICRDRDHPWHGPFQRMAPAEALMACIEGRDGLPSAATLAALPLAWLDSGLPLVAVRYEALLAETPRCLRQVLAHIGCAATPALVEAIVRRNRFERLASGRRFWQPRRQAGVEESRSHFRKGLVGDWRNHFSEAHRARFKALVGDQLALLGYESGSSW